MARAADRGSHDVQISGAHRRPGSPHGIYCVCRSVSDRAAVRVETSARIRQAAASADQFEILAADTALTQSVDSGVREFAAQMLRDHQQHVRALRDAATNADLKAPEQTLSADQAQWLGALQGVSGKEFDTLYLTQQVLAHRSALVVEQTYAERGNDSDLQRLATSTVPLIFSHIEMASHAAMNRRP